MRTASLRGPIAAALADFPARPAPCAEGFRAAVAVALVGDGDALAFWLTRRASTLRAHPGQYALPGGRCDAGEDAPTAALRELSEELGVDADPDAVLGVLDDYPTRSGYVITPVVVWVGEPARPPRPNPGEVERVYQVPVSELALPPRFVTIPESPRPVIQVPLVGTLIHAPTAAVLHQFHEVAVLRRPTRVRDFEQPVFAWR